MALTPLQAEVARVVAALPEAQDFAPAGGGALVVLGIVDRPTADLDYFATTPGAVEQLRPRLEQALRDEGLAVEIKRAVSGFAQYECVTGTASDLTRRRSRSARSA